MSKYQGRIDPLELLRTAYTEDKKIKLKDKQLIFDKDIKMPLNLPTAWLSPISSKQYSLGSLWLFMQHHLKRINDYIVKVTQYGVQSVTISDRDEIANYFTGKINTSICINQEAKLNLAIKNNQARSMPTTGFQQEGIEPTKKYKNQPLEIQVLEQIVKFQRPIMTKNRAIRLRGNPDPSPFIPLLEMLLTKEAKTEQTTSVIDKKSRLRWINQKKKNPIIIVPQHLHPGNVCLGNIQQFLIKGMYADTAGNVGFKQWIEFQYQLRNKKIKFDITNNPKTLQEDDWKCVVSIFVEGKPGQFQGWRKSSPQQLFIQTKGFLLRFPTKQPSIAHDWNIRVFTIDKNVRYRDSEVSKAIWKEIEPFLFEKVM